MIRIHITGAPRSGTTLMQALMAASYSRITAPTGEVRLWSTVPKDGIVCTKNPNDTLLAPMLLNMDKSLHFICMMRDPRDVISSKHYSAPDKYFTNLRVWREHAAIARALGNHPRFHVVRYEDLVTHPDEIQSRLGKAMGFLVRSAKFSEYSGETSDAQVETDALNGPRAVEASRLENWKEHIGRVKHQIKIHGSIDTELIDFSYEKNTAWLEELTFVESDPTPSLTPEKLNPFKAASRAVNRWLHVGAYIRRRAFGF